MRLQVKDDDNQGPGRLCLSGKIFFKKYVILFKLNKLAPGKIGGSLHFGKKGPIQPGGTEAVELGK